MRALPVFRASLSHSVCHILEESLARLLNRSFLGGGRTPCHTEMFTPHIFRGRVFSGGRAINERGFLFGPDNFLGNPHFGCAVRVSDMRNGLDTNIIPGIIHSILYAVLQALLSLLRRENRRISRLGLTAGKFVMTFRRWQDLFSRENPHFWRKISNGVDNHSNRFYLFCIFPGSQLHWRTTIENR